MMANCEIVDLPFNYLHKLILQDFSLLRISNFDKSFETKITIFVRADDSHCQNTNQHTHKARIFPS
jgi:hypothetical protein